MRPASLKRLLAAVVTLLDRHRRPGERPARVGGLLHTRRRVPAAIVTALENARSSVLVQAFTFTSAPIAKALLDASARIHIGVPSKTPMKGENEKP